MNDYKEENAIIESVSIDDGGRGLLTAWIHLKYNTFNQAFGGFALYLPKSFTHHELKSVAGHFIYRVMEIAGVDSWDKVPGRAIRVRHSSDKVYSIGHIIKDDWFTPSVDFKED